MFSLFALLFSLLLASDIKEVTVPIVVNAEPPKISVYELWDGATRSSGWSTRQVQGVPAMQSVGRAFCVSAVQLPGMVPLRVWIRRRPTGQLSYLLCQTNELWNSPEEPTIGVEDRVGETFRFFGILGYVATSPTPGMIPIHRRYSSRGRKHYYSTSQNSSSGRQPGETDSFDAYEGTPFYAYAQC